jgi:CRISPR-associated protein Csb1
MTTTPKTAKPLPADLLAPGGPACLIMKANLHPVGDLARFQPAGFPEIGHVLYDTIVDGEKRRVCIVDSAASMANHLEAVCVDGQSGKLNSELDGLPYVACVTDRDFTTKGGKVVLNPADAKDRVVVTSLSEGHRLASDYFLDATQGGKNFRDTLREGFSIVQVGTKGTTFFIPPGSWFSIYKTVFKYDPNSLLHGVLFAKEQIKISRLLTGHLEAHGAARVGRSGVKFDRLGKTTSGQPIFSVDEETAREIRATFILDLALLRSYGRENEGLSTAQKKLLLDLALWKIGQLVSRPYRYRTGCHLACESVTLETEAGPASDTELPKIDIKASISACKVQGDPMTNLYYPANELFKVDKDEGTAAPVPAEGTDAPEDQAAQP